MVGFTGNKQRRFNSCFKVKSNFTPNICEEDYYDDEKEESFNKIKKKVAMLDNVIPKKRIPGIRLLKKINKLHKIDKPKLKVEDVDRISTRMSKIINEFNF